MQSTTTPPTSIGPARQAPPRPRPPAPAPRYEGLFLEPVYVDGQPYRGEEEDTAGWDT